jgi:Domain of unknown function (DU1801)
MRMRRPFANPAVEAAFKAHSGATRKRMLDLRELIFDTAEKIEGVAPLVETLKWSQPAYLPSRPRTGTTIRLDAMESAEPNVAMLFHCQTALIGTFRELYGHELAFEGNRAVVLPVDKEMPHAVLRHCIALALTYHVKAKRR